MLRPSVKSIANWMIDTGAHPLMVELIESYLLAQDTRTMLDCVPYPDDDLELFFGGWGDASFSTNNPQNE